MRSARPVPWMKAWFTHSLTLMLGLAIVFPALAETVIQDRRDDLPLILNRHDDYVLRNVRIAGLIDMAALTLSGPIRSITIENSKFGEIWAGGNQKAAAMESVGATVATVKVTDSAFYDAENQLVSLREGSFGTVTFMHCSFKTSEAFLKRLYAENPWRTTPPTTEFYNIERLELLDNEFSNTTIIIHPSVKTVVLRGDVTKLLIESPETQVIRLDPRPHAVPEPGVILPPQVGVFAAVTPDHPVGPRATHVDPAAPAQAADGADHDKNDVEPSPDTHDNPRTRP